MLAQRVSRDCGHLASSTALPLTPRPALRAACARSRQRHHSNVAAKYQAQYQGVGVGVVEKLPEKELLLPMPTALENPADDPQLANPLERQNRMSTGW